MRQIPVNSNTFYDKQISYLSIIGLWCLFNGNNSIHRLCLQNIVAWNVTTKYFWNREFWGLSHWITLYTRCADMFFSSVTSINWFCFVTNIFQLGNQFHILTSIHQVVKHKAVFHNRYLLSTFCWLRYVCDTLVIHFNSYNNPWHLSSVARAYSLLYACWQWVSALEQLLDLNINLQCKHALLAICILRTCNNTCYKYLPTRGLI